MNALCFILAPILSGLLLVISFPTYDFGWLAPVALVPLLVAMSIRKSGYAFLSGVSCGFLFFAGVFSWTLDIPGYRAVHHVMGSLLFSLYFGLFGWLFRFIFQQRGPGLAFFSAPFLWVSLEYVRANLSFLALPWGSLAESQHLYPAAIQIVAITGCYGVSLWLIMVNTALGALILWVTPSVTGRARESFPKVSKREVGSLGVTALGVVSFVLLYGAWELQKSNVPGPAIRVSVLQGNIDQEKKHSPRKHSEFIMRKYSDLTRKAAESHPVLIVWPEAATPGFVLKDVALLHQITSLVREIGTYFLIGSSEYPKFSSEASMQISNIGNTALLFSPQGKTLGQYLKIHLVPFGEYVPLEGILPWPRFVVPEGKKSFEIPGKEFAVFQVESAKFGTLICWEVVFPSLFREFVEKGANLMINITNEGWFGDTAAPHQMVAINILRAVENRVAIARAANTGISCFIDPYGRVLGQVQKNNKRTFVEGHLTMDMPLSEEKTPYTRFGDVVAYVSLGVSLWVVGLSLGLGRRDFGSPRAEA